jgi:hypothetical protein
MSDLVKRRSRRGFLGLIAAGSAAAAFPVAARARPATSKKRPAGPAPGASPAGPHGSTGVPLAVAEGIRRQKAAVSQSLQALRDYPLPPGSEPAFGFAPRRPRKKAGAP